MGEAFVNWFYGCNGAIPWSLLCHVGLHAALPRTPCHDVQVNATYKIPRTSPLVK